jgi:hypothetical protein
MYLAVYFPSSHTAVAVPFHDEKLPTFSLINKSYHNITEQQDWNACGQAKSCGVRECLFIAAPELPAGVP